jgi:hypothetical protein
LVFSFGNQWLGILLDNLFWGQRPFLLLSPAFFRLFFLCQPPFNLDDRQLLAHAMASDFSVAWQFPKKTISLIIMDQTPHPPLA